MSEHVYRAQILLYPEQRRKLEEIARQEGLSISAKHARNEKTKWIEQSESKTDRNCD